ncbi:sigma-54 dependent transcriptional regulator [Teredinibacter turnerae]|uniref:sigma-54-dependent transcriptional regulator n=1 Tax=Teredinibacter turnerae TaxID=2426 RepID=UPI0003697535|nr:sigma-54 dependent transcriptional regulator [Teredinibacter turnerae]
MSSKRAKILVVEDDFDLREAVVDTLQLEKFSVAQAENAEAAVEMLQADAAFDLIISDVNMGKMSGHDLLLHVKQHFPHIPVLLVTAYASISDSVEAIRNGAVDYLVKPFEGKLLLKTVNKLVEPLAKSDSEPVAQAPSSKQLLELACRVAQADSTVLLIGESGTGKEVLARYIHEKSPRANRPFVAINCAAIPENMLEAMLFGHEKGAYTGAYQAAPGKFEQANGGTLLLDEISEMDLGLQAKLLRVLQEKEVERLGGRKNIPLDVRVIATSNRDMRQQVAAGKFREDLYFRLSVLPLQWAPLRDRKEDILPLAEKLLSRHAGKQHRGGVILTDEARAALLQYPWPGNVRELDNVMQRALILQPGNNITALDLGLNGGEQYSEKPSLVDVAVSQQAPQVAMAGGEQTSGAGSIAGPGHTESAAMTLDDGPQLGRDLMKREFEIIVRTLREQRGSKKNTAEKLGISARTLRYKLARLRDEGYDLDAVALF